METKIPVHPSRLMPVKMVDADGREITDVNLVSPASRHLYLKWRQNEDEDRLRVQFRCMCESEGLSVIPAFLDQHGHIAGMLASGLEGAVGANRTDVVEEMFTRGAVVDKQVSIAATSPHRELSVLKLLKAHGWDINTIVGLQHTALLYVCVIPSLIAQFKESKADMACSSNLENEDLVDWCFENGAIIDHGIEHYNPDFRLISSNYLDEAARCASVTTIDKLIERGVDKSRSFPLHNACERSSRSDEQSIRVMARLVDLGFDVNASDESLLCYGQGSPLNVAVTNTSIPKIKFLLQHGADPYLRAGTPASPFHVVASAVQGTVWEIANPELLPEVLRLFRNLPPSQD